MRDGIRLCTYEMTSTVDHRLIVLAFMWCAFHHERWHPALYLRDDKYSHLYMSVQCATPYAWREPCVLVARKLIVLAVMRCAFHHERWHSSLCRLDYSHLYLSVQHATAFMAGIVCAVTVW